MKKIKFGWYFIFFKQIPVALDLFIHFYIKFQYWSYLPEYENTTKVHNTGTSVAEPQGAASFGLSRSCNVMRLRLRRLWLLRCCSTWVVFKNDKLNDFIAFLCIFPKIFENFRFKESEENRMSDLTVCYLLLL
jgi:hypothetical protein